MHKSIIHTRSLSETIDVGRRLGRHVTVGMVIRLTGVMGAGKTHFVKGLAAGMGVAEQDHVISPTYDLVHEHGDPCRLVHIDLYRLGQPSAEDVEWLIGYLNEEETVKAIEWAERIADVMPEDAMTVEIAYGEGDGDRVITVTSPQPLEFLE